MGVPGNANALLLRSAAAAGGYQVSRSLRFNSADSAYLNRTPASAGNRRTFTFSCWLKRCKFDETHSLLRASDTYLQIYFTDNQIYSNLRGGATNYFISYAAVLRDPSQWYHIVWAVDTTQATASNRQKVYLNGVELTTAGSLGQSYPPQNELLSINDVVSHTISGTSYLNGYLAECHFIDGSAKVPGDFAETDATTGQWIPKLYSGSYGTNGFKLTFADNSAATAAALGKDTANSNNWTPNNFSVTAGAGNDSLVDTPTSFGSDTGVGNEVRGNYCTLNPLKKGSSLTFTNGNLDQSGSGQFQHSTSTFVLTTGKWYFEITHLVGEGNSVVGLVNAAGLRANEEASNYLGQTANGYGFYANGQLINSGSLSGTWGTDWSATGSVIGCAFDADTGKIWFAYNGTWQASGNPATGANPAFTASNHNGLCPAGRTFSSGQLAFNFGQRAFAYTAPSGFKALVDTNLTAPVIAKPNTVMDVALYTGNGSSKSVSGLQFSPELVWMKSRSAVYSNHLVDVVRGGTKALVSDSTASEYTSNNYVTSFDSAGFTIGNEVGINNNNTTYVAWCFDAGANTVSNTQGSITSSVRANQSSGFSVISYTGTGSNATVGHQLGVAPQFLVVKSRSISGSEWKVYHASAGAANRLNLNSTDAAAANSTVWNNTAPTSTVFSVGTNGDVNQSSATYVCYAWAPVTGYSSFGSYVGNNNPNGPFVYTGFRPRFILIKNISEVKNWLIYDTARDPYNVGQSYLAPNLSNAEATITTSVDILSNGFKLRYDDGSFNGTGTQIYAAFAESPFQYARAR